MKIFEVKAKKVKETEMLPMMDLSNLKIRNIFYLNLMFYYFFHEIVPFF